MLRGGSLVSLALVLAGPALADKSPSASCMAQAERAALSGGQEGYAARYNAAFSACMGHANNASAKAGYRQQPRRPQHNIIARNCPSGASVLYRGTLYCPQG